jgi:competence protein ComEC
MAAVCALGAQLAVLYGSDWLPWIIALMVLLEIGLLIYVIAGGARSILLYPVIFLTFLSIFAMRWKNEEQKEKMIQQFCSQCETEGLKGTVTRLEEKGEQWYLYIAQASGQSGQASIGVVVILDAVPEGVIPGSRVRVKGEMEAFPSATNPGQFDAKAYYNAQGYMLRSFSAEVELQREAGFFYRVLYGIRVGVGRVLEEISCEQDLGVWCAMLLGERSALDDDTQNLFQTGGISHILAISGLHISFIGICLYGLLRKAGLSIVLSSMTGSVVLIGYTVMTGGSVSAQRACVMMLLSFGAGCLGRTPDLLSDMSLAWILIALRYPAQITQAGCQLSFGAILAVGLFLPILEENVRRNKKKGEGVKIKILRRIGMNILGAGAVQLFTWPILAWHYFEIPVYAMLLNLVVLPLVSVLFAFLLASVIWGMLCKCVGVGLLVSKILILPAHWIMALYRKLCLLSTCLPGNLLITGRPRWWQMLLYAGILGMAAVIGLLRGRRRELRLERDEMLVDQKNGVLKNPFLEYLVLLLLLTAFLAGMPRLLVRFRDNALTVVFMDVGQGDGIFLQGADFCIFVDGGSTSVSNVGLYRMKPLLLYYGVTAVDAWILTHPDRDHVSGFLELLEEQGSGDVPLIGRVITAAAGSDDASWDEIDTELLQEQVQRALVQEGMALTMGDFYMECLYPRREEAAADTNDLCAVFRVDYGAFSMLLTGDISSETEALLCERFQETPEKLSCDLLKVAHHGSKYSSSEDFLLMTKALYGVISCGKNHYGHPSEETLLRLSDAGIVPYITLEEGALVLTISGDV